MVNEVVSIKEAKERGLRFYYTGKVCSKCGTKSKRYIKSRRCLYCALKNVSWDIQFTDVTINPIRKDAFEKQLNYQRFLKEGLAFCKKHKLHEKWEKCNKYFACKICRSERSAEARKKNPLKYIVHNCKQRGFEVNITEEDVRQKLKQQNNKCALTGIRFDEVFKPSLDRIDSTKGYIKGNIQLVLHEINTMKSNFTEKRFIELCALVKEHSF